MKKIIYVIVVMLMIFLTSQEVEASVITSANTGNSCSQAKNTSKPGEKWEYSEYRNTYCLQSKQVIADDGVQQWWYNENGYLVQYRSTNNDYSVTNYTYKQNVTETSNVENGVVEKWSYDTPDENHKYSTSTRKAYDHNGNLISLGNYKHFNSSENYCRAYYHNGKYYSSVQKTLDDMDHECEIQSSVVYDYDTNGKLINYVNTTYTDKNNNTGNDPKYNPQGQVASKIIDYDYHTPGGKTKKVTTKSPGGTCAGLGTTVSTDYTTTGVKSGVSEKLADCGELVKDKYTTYSSNGKVTKVRESKYTRHLSGKRLDYQYTKTYYGNGILKSYYRTNYGTPKTVNNIDYYSNGKTKLKTNVTYKGNSKKTVKQYYNSKGKKIYSKSY